MFTTDTNVTLNMEEETNVQNVAIYDQEQNDQILTTLQFLDGSVQNDKKLMEHPKEDGTLIVDHVVNDPIQVNLTVIIADNDTPNLNDLNYIYENSIPLVIKVKNELFSNLILSSKPIKADPGYFDKTVYNLTFKEVQEAVTLYVKMSVPQVKNKKNASKVKTGHKQAQPKPSILRQGLNKITGKK